ncbi:hypothetical protein BH10BAC3_BH10BAC3_04000 [soil metagenome]
MQHQSSHFEEIFLPPVLLAGLYPHTLVVIKEASLRGGKAKENLFIPIKETAILDDIVAPMEVVEPSATSVIEPALATQKHLTWLGDFNKSILVLVNDSTSVHLADSELDLLGKMLQALKLSLGDIALVNTGRQMVSWPELTSQLAARHIIFFGVDPSSIQVPIRLPHFRVHNWNNATFLYSPSLETINKVSAEQTMLKKELWKALQELFAAF